MEAACRQLREDGVGGILATIITDEVDAMAGRLSRLASLRAQSDVIREMVVGLHIEGPFISDRPGYVGAHPASAVRPATVDIADRLVQYGEDYELVLDVVTPSLVAEDLSATDPGTTDPEWLASRTFLHGLGAAK